MIDTMNQQALDTAVATHGRERVLSELVKVERETTRLISTAVEDIDPDDEDAVQVLKVFEVLRSKAEADLEVLREMIVQLST